MFFCDSESDGFKYQSKRVWVICAYNDDIDQYSYSFDKRTIDELGMDIVAGWVKNRGAVFGTHTSHLQYLQKGTVCFHNYFQHDKPLLRKFVKDWQPECECDTYILSQLFNPDRGFHGLKQWGERLGVEKPEYDDWRGGLTEGMVHRVTEDVRITHLTYKALMDEAGDWDWSGAIDTEYRLADLMGRQELHGVKLDKVKAYELADNLWMQLQDVDNSLKNELPMQVISGSEVKKPFTQKGEYSSITERWMGESVSTVEGQFCKVSFEKTNINSFDQMKDYLITQGWQPTEYTDKGSPKITEDSFHTIKGEVGQKIARRSVLKHRAAMVFNIKRSGELSGFLNIMRDDGRIEASAITNGTNTGRMTHRNLVNVPKPNDGFVYELRELFTVADGNVMVGIDADSLEAKVMAHFVLPYKGGEEFAKDILEGDIHQTNADVWGIPRSTAKGGYFAILYGAQPTKFSLTIGKPLKEGKKLYSKFWEVNTALYALKESVTEAWKQRKGFIRGLDGRKIFIRSPHSIVNALIQSSGSIIVKRASIIADRMFREAGLKAQQVIHYHDEFEVECPQSEVEKVKEIMKKSFTEASKFYRLRVEITGTPEVGFNWKEVH